MQRMPTDAQATRHPCRASPRPGAARIRSPPPARGSPSPGWAAAAAACAGRQRKNPPERRDQEHHQGRPRQGRCRGADHRDDQRHESGRRGRAVHQRDRQRGTGGAPEALDRAMTRPPSAARPNSTSAVVMPCSSGSAPGCRRSRRGDSGLTFVDPECRCHRCGPPVHPIPGRHVQPVRSRPRPRPRRPGRGARRRGSLAGDRACLRAADAPEQRAPVPGHPLARAATRTRSRS